MSTFPVVFEISDSTQRRWLSFERVVGSGSLYTWVPRDRIESAGIQPQFQRNFETADGRVIPFEMAEIRVRLGEDIHTSLVVFAERDHTVLLGELTLTAFGLDVDSVNHRLVSVPALAVTPRALP